MVGTRWKKLHLERSNEHEEQGGFGNGICESNNVMILWKKVKSVSWEMLEEILLFCEREAMKMFRALESMTDMERIQRRGRAGMGSANDLPAQKKPLQEGKKI